MIVHSCKIAQEKRTTYNAKEHYNYERSIYSEIYSFRITPNRYNLALISFPY